MGVGGPLHFFLGGGKGGGWGTLAPPCVNNYVEMKRELTSQKLLSGKLLNKYELKKGWGRSCKTTTATKQGLMFVTGKFHLEKFHRENSTYEKFHLRKIPPMDN